MSLEVTDLEVRYGAHPALQGVSFSITSSEAVALLGPNGAGKTTLLEAIAGLTPIARGVIRHRGEAVTTMATPDRVRRGLVLVPAHGAVFAHLSVSDNLLVACHQFAWDRDLVDARVDRALSLFPNLADRLGQAAGTLSGGEQQMLALSKGLVLEPDVLLVDELTLGLAPAIVDELVDVLVALGIALVVVCQSLTIARAMATRAVWLEKGAIAFDGPVAQLTAPAP